MLHSPARINRDARLTLITAGSFMFLGVLLGAFGAHGLKKMVEPNLLETWETGARYLLLHALALFGLGLTIQACKIKLTWVTRLITLGTIIFSFDCFLYVLSGVKFFAIIVPVGGTLLLVGWGLFIWQMCFFTRRDL
ncbi:MAG: DUF423 domain-containing protein [Bacteriovoracaceae bacterium]|nr:DUF423 domain-containing protein [Bacteriovoracaceae bacterium]